MSHEDDISYLLDLLGDYLGVIPYTNLNLSHRQGPINDNFSYDATHGFLIVHSGFKSVKLKPDRIAITPNYDSTACDDVVIFNYWDMFGNEEMIPVYMKMVQEAFDKLPTVTDASYSENLILRSELADVNYRTWAYYLVDKVKERIEELEDQQSQLEWHARNPDGEDLVNEIYYIQKELEAIVSSLVYDLPF